MTVGKANRFPGLAGVGGLPHTAAVGDIAPHSHFATAHVDDVRIPFADRDSANGPTKISIGNVFPVGATITSFPDSTAGRPHIVEIVLARHASNCGRAAATEWPDRAVLQTIESTLLCEQRV